MEQLRATICNLERFAIHDGPGIQTLVFFKGCPLRCKWCSSPNTQRHVPELLHNDVRCQTCGLCVKACPLEALYLSDTDRITLDRVLFAVSCRCVSFGPTQARAVLVQQPPG